MKFQKHFLALLLPLVFQPCLQAQMRRMTSPTPAYWSFFGDAVSMHGNLAFIAEPVWHSGFGASEEVHFYRLEGRDWKRTNTIKTPLSVVEGFYGRRSGMSEHWLVFSQQNHNGTFKIHLHERVQDTFLFRQTLNAPSAFDDGSVAERIGISDEHLVFGGQGNVYFYRLVNGVWELNTIISKPGTELGHNAALHGNRAVSCDITRDVAYVFEFDGSIWKEKAALHPEANINHVFGENCAIFKDWVAVGDFVWQSNSDLDTNKIYFYKWPLGSNNAPQLVTKLKSPTSDIRNPGFGSAIEFTDEYLFVGSILDNHSSSPVEGRVHKYRRNGDRFEYLRNYGTGDLLGDCISVFGNQAMFGEPGYNINAGAVWVGPALDTLYLMHECALPADLNGSLVSEENFGEAFLSDADALAQGAPRKFGAVMLEDFFQETRTFNFCFNTPTPGPQPLDVFGNYTLLLPPDFEVEWTGEFEHDGQIFTAADLLDDVHSLRPVLVNPVPAKFELTLNYGKPGEDACISFPVEVGIVQTYCPSDTVFLSMVAGDTITLNAGCSSFNDPADLDLVWQADISGDNFSSPNEFETRFFPVKDANVWFMIFPPPGSNCPTLQRNFVVNVTVIDADNDGSPSYLDCDDQNPLVFPGGIDLPLNGLDEDCVGGDDDYCFERRPGAQFGKDARVSSRNPSTNYANGQTLLVALTNPPPQLAERSLLAFDLRSIPPDGTVDSAFLSLYYNPTATEGSPNNQHAGAANIFIERITQSWSETNLKWNNHPATTIENRVEVLKTDHPGNTADWLDLDVKNLVADMVDPTKGGNHGFVLRLTVESTPARQLLFASSDHPDANLRPQLKVCWHPKPSASAELEKPRGLRVFPNPGSNFLNVELPETMPVRLRLFAADGRLARAVSGEARLFQIEVSDLPAGVYTLASDVGWVAKWVKF